ncbi:MAG: hypothetical protein E6G70_13015 [Alphaproteobacteria bacterium]|nr:MAG: hypothetical protein E6G70_13015 [Alphaproteobacteria bacterium]
MRAKAPWNGRPRSGALRQRSLAACALTWSAGARSTKCDRASCARPAFWRTATKSVVNRIHDGQPLAGKIRSAWEGILQDAGLGEDVVRHSLRHTAATWLMQAGVDMWEAAGGLGMTVEQLEASYRLTILNSRKKPLRRLAAGASPPRGTWDRSRSLRRRAQIARPSPPPKPRTSQDASPKSAQTDRWL